MKKDGKPIYSQSRLAVLVIIEARNQTCCHVENNLTLKQSKHLVNTKRMYICPKCLNKAAYSKNETLFDSFKLLLKKQKSVVQSLTV